MKQMMLAAALLLVTSAASAQITKPIRYTWIATSCTSWNTAAAALIMANGDKHVIVLPTGNDSHPWLILKRVEEGSIFIPEDEPYACEIFANVSEAGSRFTAMDGCHGAIMLNVPDGRAVVVSLNKCDESKRRVMR